MMTDIFNKIAEEGVLNNLMDEVEKKTGNKITPNMRRVNTDINHKMDEVIRREMIKCLEEQKIPVDLGAFMQINFMKAINELCQTYKDKNDMAGFELLTWIKGAIGLPLKDMEP